MRNSCHYVLKWSLQLHSSGYEEQLSLCVELILTVTLIRLWGTAVIMCWNDPYSYTHQAMRNSCHYVLKWSLKLCLPGTAWQGSNRTLWVQPFCEASVCAVTRQILAHQPRCKDVYWRSVAGQYATVHATELHIQINCKLDNVGTIEVHTCVCLFVCLGWQTVPWRCITRSYRCVMFELVSNAGHVFSRSVY
jgi:hypothetical protein